MSGYNDYEKPFTFDRVIRLLISAVLFGFAIYMVFVLSNVLLPFLVAWLIAYLLNPLVRFFQYKLKIKNRPLSVILTFFLVIGVFSLLLYLLVPMVKTEIFQINELISLYQDSSLGNVHGIPVNIYEFISETVDFDEIRASVSKEHVQETLNYLIPKLEGLVSEGISFIIGLTVIFIIILYLIFILMDYDKINLLWMNLIPHKHRKFVGKLVGDVEKNMNLYFRHQALICVIVGILFAICFQIIGMPLAILMGLLIAILHMIPYMHTFSIAPAAMLCWLRTSQTGDSFWQMFGIVLLIYIGIQCIIDLILVPKIMGKAMGLNPAIILLSLSVWGALLGIVGMIIAIPLTTLLLSYYQQFIDSTANVEIEKIVEKQSENQKKE